MNRTNNNIIFCCQFTAVVLRYQNADILCDYIICNNLQHDLFLHLDSQSVHSLYAKTKPDTIKM